MALAVALIALAGMSARLGLAESLGDEVQEDQLAWRDQLARTGEVVPQKEWDAARQKMARARHLDAGNPRLAEQMAGLMQVAVRRSGTAGDDTVTTHAADAVALYEEAAHLRPSSPYTWANLAWAHYSTGLAAGQANQKFFAALGNAARLGPWEREIQLLVVDLGLAMWEELPGSLRREVTTTARNAQRRFAPEIVAIADRRGRLAEVCGFDRAALTESCKRFNSPPGSPNPGNADGPKAS